MTHKLQFASARVACAVILLAAFGTGVGLAQGRRQRGPRVTVHLVPFALVKQQAGFPAILPDMKEFNEMEALRATITPAVLKGLKKDAPSIQLNFGYKKGGVGVVYEMPAQPGLKADAVFKALIDAGVYKERTYFKEWSFSAVPDKNLFIAVSGTTPEVKAALIRALGK